MTFEEWLKLPGSASSNPDDWYRECWNACVEECIKIAERPSPYEKDESIGRDIRALKTKNENAR
jgi:hypothetical protein